MTAPPKSAPGSRFAFLLGIAVWTVLARSGTAADVRPAGSADYRIPHARFSADMEVALRNENWKEIAGVCARIQDRGGFPDWMIEYGRLLLDSCPEKAVLFTGSLADTDSALYWQSVQGYRRDVAVLAMGFLDRSWFMESLSRRYGVSLETTGNPVLQKYSPRIRSNAGYSRDLTSRFYRILRSNVSSRPVCLSMDLSPDLLRQMLQDLVVRGFIFEYKAFSNEISEAEAVTGRLLLRRDGFPGVTAAGRTGSDLDSLRSHYRFVAVDFLRHAGDRLPAHQRKHLISLIHGPFSRFILDTGMPVPQSPAGVPREEP